MMGDLGLFKIKILVWHFLWVMRNNILRSEISHEALMIYNKKIFILGKSSKILSWGEILNILENLNLERNM